MVPPPVRSPFSSLLLRSLWLAPVVAFVVCVYACGSGDTTGITPTTGIVVRADDLVAGYGCGTGPNQIYQYAAVVSTVAEGGAQPLFVAGGAYPCYADATFINLCASTSGSLTFNVEVYAFTQAQWAAVGAGLPAQLSIEPSYCNSDASVVPTLYEDGGQGLLARLESSASLVTTCTATQQENIEVEAVCNALTAVPASAP